MYGQKESNLGAVSLKDEEIRQPVKPSESAGASSARTGDVGQPARPKGLWRPLLVMEKAAKEVVFDCRMCGQCILHSTGLTCPMRCPKNLRNGPCGGVLANGNCEVLPDKPCIWNLAWQRSQKLPLWRDHMEDTEHLNPPLDWRLEGTGSWENLASGRDRQTPAGWHGNGHSVSE